MKKSLLLLLPFVVLLMVSCEDEPIDDGLQTGGTSCEQAVLNTADAALNFLGVNADNYTQLCVAYRNALQAQVQACGDEDGSLQAAIEALGDCTDQNQQSSDLEGTWLLTAWLIDEAYDLNNDGTESFNLLDEMDCYNNETIVFNSDGTAVVTSTSYAEIDVSIEVGTTDSFDYIVNCIQETEVSNVAWTQNNNTVTISDGSSDLEWTLSGNQLSIFVPEGFFAISEDQTIVQNDDLTFVYTKQ
ncbi:MAG: hypothetical protein GYB32_10625 [Algicola sp.]|nr:hypothetical protein [Algicola sp.]